MLWSTREALGPIFFRRREREYEKKVRRPKSRNDQKTRRAVRRKLEKRLAPNSKVVEGMMTSRLLCPDQTS